MQHTPPHGPAYREELLAQAAKAESLQELSNLACLILGNPIFIEDRSYVVLAYSDNVDIADPKWNEEIRGTQKKSPNIRQIKDMERNYSGAFQSGSAVVAHDDDLPYPRIIKPLLLKNEHIGTMVCTGYCSPIREADISLIDILAVFAISILRDDAYVISSRHDAIDNYLIKLLMGNHIPTADARSYVEAIRWNEKPYHYIMALCPMEYEGVPAMPLYDILEEAGAQANCHALIFDSRVLCICSLKHPVDGWEASFPILVKVMQKYRLFAGISQSFENPALMNTYYRQAKSTAQIAAVLRNRKPFCCYNDVSLYHLFEALPGDTDLRQFCHEKILALESYDTKHNTDLAPTLHAYLESRCSISKTAEKMFVHRNTIHYRIRKCYELLECELEDGDDFFSCIFSLRILEYANKRMGKF